MELEVEICAFKSLSPNIFLFRLLFGVRKQVIELPSRLEVVNDFAILVKILQFGNIQF